MKKLSALCISLFSLIFSISLQAQNYTTPPPPPMYQQPIQAPHYHPPGAPEKKDKVSIDNQYYEMDAEGLRSYMEAIKDSQPELYAFLNPDLEELEADYSTGKKVKWWSIGIGAALLFHGYSTISTEAKAVADDHDKEMSSTGLTLMTAGITCAFVGMLVHNAMLPEKKDYLNFINKHNAKEPKSPIHVTASVNPYERFVGMGLSYTF